MTNKQKWQERIEELTCINYAMYLGVIDDDKEKCPCGKMSCEQEQYWDEALSELKGFITEEMQKQREEVIEECMFIVMAHHGYAHVKCESLENCQEVGYVGAVSDISDRLQALKQKNHD